jgi:hypothetical protein
MHYCHARFPFHAAQTPTTTLSQPPRSKRASLIEDIESDEETLVEEFGIDGAAAEEVLGYDPDNDEEEAEEEEEEDEDQNDEDEGDEDDKAFEELRKRVRLEATQQSEANRRAGGIKTQRAMVRAWEVRFYFLFFLKKNPSELMKILRNLSKSHWRRRKSVTT